MKSQFQPWQLLLLILAGWINSRQQDAVEYLPFTSVKIRVQNMLLCVLRGSMTAASSYRKALIWPA